MNTKMLTADASATPSATASPTSSSTRSTATARGAAAAPARPSSRSPGSSGRSSKSSTEPTKLLVYGDNENNHTRCGVCGSLLYSLVDGERVHVALGSLADEPSIRPRAHIFVGAKAPWLEITDDLPQFEELPD